MLGRGAHLQHPCQPPKITPTTAAVLTQDPTPPAPLLPPLHFRHPKSHSWHFLPQVLFFLLTPADQGATAASPPSQHKHLPHPTATHDRVSHHPRQAQAWPCLDPTCSPGSRQTVWPRHRAPTLPHCQVPELPPSPRGGGLTCSILSPCQPTHWPCTKNSGITLIMQQLLKKFGGAHGWSEKRPCSGAESPRSNLQPRASTSHPLPARILPQPRPSSHPRPAAATEPSPSRTAQPSRRGKGRRRPPAWRNAVWSQAQ